MLLLEPFENASHLLLSSKRLNKSMWIYPQIFIFVALLNCLFFAFFCFLIFHCKSSLGCLNSTQTKSNRWYNCLLLLLEPFENTFRLLLSSNRLNESVWIYSQTFIFVLTFLCSIHQNKTKKQTKYKTSERTPLLDYKVMSIKLHSVQSVC